MVGLILTIYLAKELRLAAKIVHFKEMRSLKRENQILLNEYKK